MADTPIADMVLHHGLFTTLDRAQPTATAVAISDGRFTHVGNDHEIMALVGPRTRVIDLRGRRVLPGLIDNHLHIIRGGLNFNMELRWDGVRSLQTYHRSGVKIAAGSDAGLDSVGYEMLPMELKFMRIAGLSPMETLMAATRNAAELMGLSERCGTLEAGKKADFLIVNADPLENPDALYQLHSVYKAGRRHEPNAD